MKRTKSKFAAAGSWISTDSKDPADQAQVALHNRPVVFSFGQVTPAQFLKAVGDVDGYRALGLDLAVEFYGKKGIPSPELQPRSGLRGFIVDLGTHDQLDRLLKSLGRGWGIQQMSVRVDDAAVARGLGLKPSSRSANAYYVLVLDYGNNGRDLERTTENSLRVRRLDELEAVIAPFWG